MAFGGYHIKYLVRADTAVKKDKLSACMVKLLLAPMWKVKRVQQGFAGQGGEQFVLIREGLYPPTGCLFVVRGYAAVAVSPCYSFDIKRTHSQDRR